MAAAAAEASIEGPKKRRKRKKNPQGDRSSRSAAAAEMSSSSSIVDAVARVFASTFPGSFLFIIFRLAQQYIVGELDRSTRTRSSMHTLSCLHAGYVLSAYIYIFRCMYGCNLALLLDVVATRFQIFLST